MVKGYISIKGKKNYRYAVDEKFNPEGLGINKGWGLLSR